MQTNSKEKLIREVFYLSKEDRELLRLKAGQLCVPTSFFVRNCVLKELGKQILIPKERNVEVDGYRNSLQRIGINLNQIARKVNKGVNLKLVDEGDLSESINLIKDHIKEVQSKL